MFHLCSRFITQKLSMATSSSRRSCLNNPNDLCHICGQYTLLSNRNGISEFVKRAYLAYFKVRLGDQDKAWAPHIVCKQCVEHLRQWTKKVRKSLRFGIPMVWREPKNHFDDCYFCSVSTKGINRKNRNSLVYPNLESAIRPIPHCSEVPVPVFESLPELELPGIEEDRASVLSTDSSETTASDVDFTLSSPPQLFSQRELNDLTRDLNLSKESSELLASRLKEKNLLQPGTLITFYRKRHSEFLPYFNQENDIVYCKDVAGLLQHLGVQHYNPQDWRLFIDSSKRSLKCVLLHNGNLYGSIPLGHSTTLKEKYDEIKFVLEKNSYNQHQWIICVDLKMVAFLLGLQSGYTKFPCFLCLWDSRARKEHWTRKDWPVRSDLIPGSLNVLAPPLVERSKIVFPPLHIKLGIMKQFVKALEKDGDCFKYICRKFPGLSIEKLKAGVFDGPQIRKLMDDAKFFNFMNPTELSAWNAFVNVDRVCK